MVSAMRKMLLAILLAPGGSALLPTGCADPGPAGPTLPSTFVFKYVDYEEKGGLLPIKGTLELTIEPDGHATAATRREFLHGVVRRDPLRREQLVELITKVDAWTAEGVHLPPKGQNQGLVVYGEKKAGWEKDASLPPKLKELVDFLLTIPPTLHVEKRDKGR